MATLTIPFRSFQDTRSPALVSNFFLIPSGSGSFKLRLIEIPQSGVVTPPSSTDAVVVRQVDPITHIYNPSIHKLFTVITVGTPTSDQVLVDATSYVTGELGFIYSGNVGLTIEIIYQGTGSKLFSADLNEIAAGTLINDRVILSRHLNIQLDSDPTPSVANVGSIYYNTTDKQYKGIAEDSTPGTYKIVILG